MEDHDVKISIINKESTFSQGLLAFSYEELREGKNRKKKTYIYIYQTRMEKENKNQKQKKKKKKWGGLPLCH